MILNGSELVARLVACGFTESTARDTCEKYAAEGDFSGLERFIRQNELFFNIYVSAVVDVPRGCCVTVAAKNTSTQPILVANSNFIVERIA